MSNVSLTSAMSSNLLSLKQTTSLMSMTQNRLATGLKVNSAIDNPSAYYTAVSLNNRAADLNTLLDNMGQAIQTVKAAVEAVETATKFLAQMQSITEQALAEPIATQTTTSSSEEFKGYTKITSDMRTADIQALITEGAKLVLADDITLTEGLEIEVDNVILDGNGHKLSYINTTDDDHLLKISGSNTKIKNISFDYQNDDVGVAVEINSANNVEMSNFEITATGDEATGVFAEDSTIEMSNFEITVTGEDSCSVYAGHSSTIEMSNFEITVTGEYSLVFTINKSTIEMSNFEIMATGDYFRGVNVSNDSTVEMSNFEITATGDYSRGISATSRSIVTMDSDVGINISGANSEKFYEGSGSSRGHIEVNSSLKGDGSGPRGPLGVDDETSSVPENIGVAVEWSKAFNNVLNQYDMLIDDASYRGINLLKGEQLNVAFNEDKSSKLNILGKDIHSSALGLSSAAWETVDDVNKAVSDLQRCVATLRSLSSELGNNYSVVQSRQDFTESLINILTEGADKLTLADMNEESAIMLALQTRQQLAINSLSLASQSAQSVLRLFA